MKLALLLFFGMAVCFPGTLPAESPAVPQNVLIWEATHKELPGKLYLAGTLHAAPRSLYPLDSTYDRVLKEVSGIGLEIREEEMAELPALIRRYGYFGGGNGKLSSCFSFLDFQKVCSFFMQHNPQYTPGELERHRPWLLYTHAVHILLLKYPEYKTEYAMEKILLQHAGKKRVFTLESAQSQIRLLALVPDRDSARVLLETLHNTEKAGKDLEKIMLALQSGDPAVLEEMVREIQIKYPSFHKNLLTERNKNITEKLLQALREKETLLILAGAAHFVGDQSIPSLLEERGCRIRLLPSSGKSGKIAPALPVKK